MHTWSLRGQVVGEWGMCLEDDLEIGTIKSYLGSVTTSLVLIY